MDPIRAQVLRVSGAPDREPCILVCRRSGWSDPAALLSKNLIEGPFGDDADGKAKTAETWRGKRLLHPGDVIVQDPAASANLPDGLAHTTQAPLALT